MVNRNLQDLAWDCAGTLSHRQCSKARRTEEIQIPPVFEKFGKISEIRENSSETQ
jgi:hypothetical protein